MVVRKKSIPSPPHLALSARIHCICGNHHIRYWIDLLVGRSVFYLWLLLSWKHLCRTEVRKKQVTGPKGRWSEWSLVRIYTHKNITKMLL